MIHRLARCIPSTPVVIFLFASFQETGGHGAYGSTIREGCRKTACSNRAAGFLLSATHRKPCV